MRRRPNEMRVHRRPVGYWHLFNEWYRGQMLDGIRPDIEFVETWFYENAARLWPDESERPGWREAKIHAKSLRSTDDVKSYFQKYRAEKKEKQQQQQQLKDSDALGTGEIRPTEQDAVIVTRELHEQASLAALIFQHNASLAYTHSGPDPSPDTSDTGAPFSGGLVGGCGQDAPRHRLRPHQIKVPGSISQGGLVQAAESDEVVHLPYGRGTPSASHSLDSKDLQEEDSPNWPYSNRSSRFRYDDRCSLHWSAASTPRSTPQTPAAEPSASAFGEPAGAPGQRSSSLNFRHSGGGGGDEARFAPYPLSTPTLTRVKACFDELGGVVRIYSARSASESRMDGGVGGPVVGTQITSGSVLPTSGDVGHTNRSSSLNAKLRANTMPASFQQPPSMSSQHQELDVECSSQSYGSTRAGPQAASTTPSYGQHTAGAHSCRPHSTGPFRGQVLGPEAPLYFLDRDEQQHTGPLGTRFSGPHPVHPAPADLTDGAVHVQYRCSTDAVQMQYGHGDVSRERIPKPGSAPPVYPAAPKPSQLQAAPCGVAKQQLPISPFVWMTHDPAALSGTTVQRQGPSWESKAGPEDSCGQLLSSRSSNNPGGTTHSPSSGRGAVPQCPASVRPQSSTQIQHSPCKPPMQQQPQQQQQLPADSVHQCPPSWGSHPTEGLIPDPDCGTEIQAGADVTRPLLEPWEELGAVRCHSSRPAGAVGGGLGESGLGAAAAELDVAEDLPVRRQASMPGNPRKRNSVSVSACEGEGGHVMVSPGGHSHAAQQCQPGERDLMDLDYKHMVPIRQSRSQGGWAVAGGGHGKEAGAGRERGMVHEEHRSWGSASEALPNLVYPSGQNTAASNTLDTNSQAQPNAAAMDSRGGDDKFVAGVYNEGSFCLETLSKEVEGWTQHQDERGSSNRPSAQRNRGGYGQRSCILVSEQIRDATTNDAYSSPRGASGRSPAPGPVTEDSCTPGTQGGAMASTGGPASGGLPAPPSQPLGGSGAFGKRYQYGGKALPDLPRPPPVSPFSTMAAAAAAEEINRTATTNASISSPHAASSPGAAPLPSSSQTLSKAPHQQPSSLYSPTAASSPLRHTTSRPRSHSAAPWETYGSDHANWGRTPTTGFMPSLAKGPPPPNGPTTGMAPHNSPKAIADRLAPGTHKGVSSGVMGGSCTNHPQAPPSHGLPEVHFIEHNPATPPPPQSPPASSPSQHSPTAVQEAQGGAAVEELAGLGDLQEPLQSLDLMDDDDVDMEDIRGLLGM